MTTELLSTQDPMVMAIVRRMVARSEEGMATYGVTMADAKKDTQAWINDAQEELWDAIVYLEKLKHVLK